MRDNYLFFACNISMRRVAWGALPCMCLKYRKSSPRWAIDLGNDLFKMDLSGFFSDFSRFTSVRGSALTAGCTSPAIRRALRFIDYQSSCQIDIGSESVYIQSGFDLIGTFAFEFVTAIHYLLLKVKESGKNLSPFTI